MDELDQVKEEFKEEDELEHISPQKDYSEYKHAAEELITEKMEVAYSSGKPMCGSAFA